MSNFDKNKILKEKISYSDTLRYRLDKFIKDSMDLSQRQFAKEVGIDYQKLNKLINGDTKVIDATFIGKIINDFDLNPIWFFTGKGSKKLSGILDVENIGDEDLRKALKELQEWKLEKDKLDEEIEEKYNRLLEEVDTMGNNIKKLMPTEE